MRKDSFLGDGDQRKISREVHLYNHKNQNATYTTNSI
jgi:hypothetical protein